MSTTVYPGLWAVEFGEGYAVPTEISAALTDQSWHNDACPSFGVYDDSTDLRLWVEHPDPKLREGMSVGRFMVLNGDFVVYDGDDAAAALAAWWAASTGSHIDCDRCRTNHPADQACEADRG